MESAKVSTDGCLRISAARIEQHDQKATWGRNGRDQLLTLRSYSTIEGRNLGGGTEAEAVKEHDSNFLSSWLT